jgi:Ser/Thr protein kinase RdoA (MazF antagonist)
MTMNTHPNPNKANRVGVLRPSGIRTQGVPSEAASLDGVRKDARFATAVAETYGLRLSAMIERRTVSGFVDSQGRKWLWKPAASHDDEERLAAIAHMVQQISPEVSFAGPVPNQTGRFLSHVTSEDVGYLQPWLFGRHVSPRVPLERVAAMATIGRLHQLTGQPRLCRAELHRGSLMGKLRMKTKAVSAIWPELRAKSPLISSFEPMLRRRMEEILRTYEHAVHFPAVMSRKSGPQSFCHRDLAPHNLLWQDGQVALIDFDHAGFDDPLHDAIQFLSHCMFLSSMTPTELRELVTTYEETANLPEERRQLFRKLLAWPDIFIRTAVEWCRQGCPASREPRLLYAIQKEQRRTALLLAL